VFTIWPRSFTQFRTLSSACNCTPLHRAKTSVCLGISAGCSRACQKSDWKHHKLLCKTLCSLHAFEGGKPHAETLGKLNYKCFFREMLQVHMQSRAPCSTLDLLSMHCIVACESASVACKSDPAFSKLCSHHQPHSRLKAARLCS
jgi:hypothetical protein